jgi:hypothetical protein
MAFVPMNRRPDNFARIQPALPPRIKAAFDYLEYARVMTTCYDALGPRPTLTQLQRSVESAALRAIQQYLLGEMDFADAGTASVSPAPPQNE